MKQSNQVVFLYQSLFCDSIILINEKKMCGYFIIEVANLWHFAFMVQHLLKQLVLENFSAITIIPEFMSSTISEILE